MYWILADNYQSEPIRFPLMVSCNWCEMWLQRDSQWGDFSPLQLDLCLGEARHCCLSHSAAADLLLRFR